MAAIYPSAAHNTNNTPHCGPSAGEKPGTPFRYIRARQVGEPARPLKGREERSKHGSIAHQH